MKEEKIMTTAELLAARKWTRFLKQLPDGRTDWRITDYRDFVSLRTVAALLSMEKSDYDRKFSFEQSKEDKTIYVIEVTPKSDGKK